MLKVEGATNFVAPPFRQMYEGFQPGEALDPLPDYLGPRESHTNDPELAKRFPLNIVSPKSHYFLNSCYANMEDKQKGQGEQFVMISAEDARARGILDGDRVKVANDRGAFKGVARITDDVKSGIVVATLGYWRQLNEGTVNSISSGAFTDMGHARPSRTTSSRSRAPTDDLAWQARAPVPGRVARARVSWRDELEPVRPVADTVACVMCRYALLPA